MNDNQLKVKVANELILPSGDQVNKAVAIANGWVYKSRIGKSRKKAWCKPKHVQSCSGGPPPFCSGIFNLMNHLFSHLEEFDLFYHFCALIPIYDDSLDLPDFVGVILKTPNRWLCECYLEALEKWPEEWEHQWDYDRRIIEDSEQAAIEGEVK